MARHEDRVGALPYLYELDGLKGFDIDWEEQFAIGELIYASGLASGTSLS
jgi:hypothetical protein